MVFHINSMDSLVLYPSESLPAVRATNYVLKSRDLWPDICSVFLHDMSLTH